MNGRYSGPSACETCGVEGIPRLNTGLEVSGLSVPFQKSKVVSTNAFLASRDTQHFSKAICQERRGSKLNAACAPLAKVIVDRDAGAARPAI